MRPDSQPGYPVHELDDAALYALRLVSLDARYRTVWVTHPETGRAIHCESVPELTAGLEAGYELPPWPRA